MERALSDRNTSNNQLVRVQITRTDDAGGYQKVWATGRDGEVLGGQTGLLRSQAFGHSSHIPKGAHGLALIINGNPDQAVLLTIEHPDHRPTDAAEGDTFIYDGHGQTLHMYDGFAVLTVGTLKIIADTVIVDSPDINLGGLGGKPVAVQGTITSDGASLVSNFATKVKAV